MLEGRGLLNKELSELNDNILKLGSLVENALTNAMQALSEQDAKLAQEVIVGDEQVNQLRYEIEEEALRILATQSPAASDLRQVIAVMHIATELERIGDHASGIARLVDRIGDEADIETLHQLPKMAKRGLKMIRQSLEAFINHDADMALNTIERDTKLDKQYGKFSDNMMEELQDETADPEMSTYLFWMGHNLERIGDRVTNIAERVIFMVTGKFVEMHHN